VVAVGLLLLLLLEMLAVVVVNMVLPEAVAARHKMEMPLAPEEVEHLVLSELLLGDY
jgi:hypothetical protein